MINGQAAIVPNPLIGNRAAIWSIRQFQGRWIRWRHPTGGRWSGFQGAGTPFGHLHARKRGPVQVAKPFLERRRNVGHEAARISPWLHPELKKLGLPAICLETLLVCADCAAQRDNRQGRRAGHRASDAHRLVPPGLHQVGDCYRTKLLRPTGATSRPTSSTRKTPSALAEGVQDPPKQGRTRRFRAGGVRRRCGRSAAGRTDGCHPDGTRRAVETVLSAARSRSSGWSRRANHAGASWRPPASAR